MRLRKQSPRQKKLNTGMRNTEDQIKKVKGLSKEVKSLKGLT